MNDNFKNQLAAFARDVKAICDANPDTCEYCQLRNHGWCVKPLLSTDLDDIDKMLAAVEAYRKRKKPCAEVIDRCVDIYEIEVEIQRKGAAPSSVSAKYYADGLRKHLTAYYGQFINGSFAARVLSAKRFVLKSHKEDE